MGDALSLYRMRRVEIVSRGQNAAVGYEDEQREPLDPDDWEVREVFAKFGLAIFHCQVLETGIGNYLAVLRRIKSGREMTPEQVDDLLLTIFAKPLGQNPKEIRDYFGDQGTWVLKDEMGRALDLRNQLVHHWMRQRVLEGDNSAKRQAMLTELEAAIEQLEQADRLVTERTKLMYAKAGISWDDLMKDLERLEGLAKAGEEDKQAPPYFRRPD